jgi:hypothetical protein
MLNITIINIKVVRRSFGSTLRTASPKNGVGA